MTVEGNSMLHYHRISATGNAGVVLLLFLIMATTGCNTASTRSNPEAPYTPSRPPVTGDILHMRTGVFVNEENMLQAVTDVRIAYVGEAHNDMASHRLQLKVVQAMAKRWSGQIAIGMEMFIPGQQEALRRWVAGESTEAEFLSESKWKERWNVDFDYYRPLLLFARENGIPVIGLNVPKSLVHAVAKMDFSELPEDERRQLPDMDINNPYRDALVRAFYGGHAKGKNGLEGFRRVQALWDEAMAENAVRYLNSPDGQHRHMVIIAGGNHIRYGIGIPHSVFRRLPGSYVLVGTRVLKISEVDKVEIMNVELPDFPMLPYDYLVFVDYEKLKKPDADTDGSSAR